MLQLGRITSLLVAFMAKCRISLFFFILIPLSFVYVVLCMKGLPKLTCQFKCNLFFHPLSLMYGYGTNCLVSFRITYFMQNYFKLNRISLEQSESDDW